MLQMDPLALQIQDAWQAYFPSATLMPGIGAPSQNKQGWFLLTHQIDGAPPMRINGRPCRSPLCANALLSGEWTEGAWMNLYEIMLEDLPDPRTGVSTVQYYLNALRNAGLDVAGVHFHWTGAPGVLAIHHQKTGMEPQEFTRRTLQALTAALKNAQRVKSERAPARPEAAASPKHVVAQNSDLFDWQEPQAENKFGFRKWLPQS